MKGVRKIGILFIFLFGSSIAFLLFAAAAWANEGETGWRGSYDVIMMWINFAILAFVLIKFGRSPIKSFFSNQRETISRKISQIEEEKAANAAQILQAHNLMQESSQRFAQIKAKIIAEGEQKKQAIIDDARRESRLMFDQVNFWIDRHTQQAGEKLKSEVIDEAMAMVMEKLPQVLTPEDNQKFIGLFLNEIGAK